MKHFLKTHQTVLTILLIAILVRLPLLNGSFWLDEAAQALESSRPFDQQLDIIKDFQPPLLHLILHFAMYLSSSEWWLRTVGALVPGLISIWATYQIGQRLLSKRAASIASLLLATNSFHVFYSQELRPYALPLMWATLSWYLLILLMDYLTKKSLIDLIKVPFTKSVYIPAQPLLLAMYFSATTLGLYSSYIYPFLVLSQILFAIFLMRKMLGKLITTWLASGIFFLPWMPIFMAQLQVGGSWRQIMPGWDQVVSLPQLKALPLVAGKFIFGAVNLEPNYFFLLSLFFILLLVINSSLWLFKSFSIRQLLQDKAFALPLIWLVMPILSAWLVSFFVPVVQPKRLLLSLPALYLLIVYFLQTDQLFSKTQFIKNFVAKGGKKTAVNWLLKLYGRVSAWVLIVVLLLVNIGGLNSYWTDLSLQRENWRELYQTITTRYKNGSIVVFVFDESFAPWTWYSKTYRADSGVDKKEFPTFNIGTLNINQVENLRDQVEVLNNYRYLLVFDYLQDLTDPDKKLIKELGQFGFNQVDLIDRPGIGFVRVFSKEQDVLSLRKAI